MWRLKVRVAFFLDLVPSLVGDRRQVAVQVVDRVVLPQRVHRRPRFARRKISCVVILPAGKIATANCSQAFAYGAKIVAIDGHLR